MIKSLIKDLGARKAIAMLTNSKLGRAMLCKGVSLAGKKLGIALSAQQVGNNSDMWQFCIGEPGANLRLQCTIHTVTLAELTELAGSAWCNDTKLSMSDILSALKNATKADSALENSN